MFYSHEILTSREAGIATVWLVATLGSSKGKSKRINRKSILAVDVPKACQIIIQPEAPMALRLQSNLLYGVTRVLSRQFEYVLSDAQITQTNMRMLLKAVRTSVIDMNAGKANPDQLMIHDDPAFLPDLTLPGLDIDLLSLGISSDESARHSSILSPSSQRSSEPRLQENEQSIVGLIVPSSDIGESGNIGRFVLPSESGDSGRRMTPMIQPMIDEEDFNVDPGFSVDDEGNLRQDTDILPGTPRRSQTRIGIDSDGVDNARQRLIEGFQTHHSEDRPIAAEDVQMFHDEEIDLPTMTALPAEHSQPASQIDPIVTQASHDSSPHRVIAPLQRLRRPLPVDERTDVSSAVQKDWGANYLHHMEEAKAAKRRKTATTTAKRTAENWTLRYGIGGVGARLGRAQLENPLSVLFSGPSLVESSSGREYPFARPKRSREDAEEDEPERESQRPRHDSDGLQGDDQDSDLTLQEDWGVLPESEDIEIGRHAQPTLEDPSFPWNVTVSVHGSRHSSVPRSYRQASIIGGFASSVGQPPSSAIRPSSIIPGSLERRASRMTSASPSLGRRPLRLSSPGVSAIGGFESLGGLPDDLDPEAIEDFALYGPGAAVDTQTAAQSQWIRAALTQEAGNFLAFVKNAISGQAEAGERERTESSALTGSAILFEELLPPAEHSRIVGAQAIHHVLALASAGQLNIIQSEAFGPIELSVPAEH